MATSSTVETVREPHRPETTTCPECNGRVHPDGIEHVCDRCGLILDTDPIVRQPVRYYPGDGGPDPRHRRVVNAARHDRGLGSEIGFDGGLPERQRRLDRHVRAGDPTQRARRYAFGEVNRLVSSLDLPDVVRDTACRIYVEAHDAGVVRGRDHDGVATAAVVGAARIHRESVTFDAIGDVARVGRDRVVSAYDEVVRELALAIPPPQAAAFVGRIADSVGVPAKVRTDAERLCRKREGATSGRTPPGVAAAAVYISSGNGVRQTDCADAAGVTAVTVRAAMRVLEGEDDG